MKPETKAYILREGGKIVSDLVKLRMIKPKKPTEITEGEEEAFETKELPVTAQEPAKPARIVPEGKTQVAEGVATACVPCALGHFSTSAGLLKEAVRFKGEGITSNEIQDRVARVLEEQNTLERVDLTPEKVRSTPDWERTLAEGALQQSRSLRHRLETIESIDDLEGAAADTSGYYRSLHREWWKLRLEKPSKAEEPEMTLEDAKKMAAEEATRLVESRWPKE